MVQNHYIYLRFENDQNHIPSVIKGPQFLLVPVEKLCSLLRNDWVFLHFFFSQFRNEKILDPLEHNHEEEQEAFQEGAQCPQHFETKLKQVEKFKLKLKLKKSRNKRHVNLISKGN